MLLSEDPADLGSTRDKKPRPEGPPEMIWAQHLISREENWGAMAGDSPRVTWSPSLKPWENGKGSREESKYQDLNSALLSSRVSLGKSPYLSES